MKIASVQSKSIAGDLKGNLAKALKYTEKAKSDGAELIIFSNGTLTGLNIKSLIYDATFFDECQNINKEFTEKAMGIDILIPTLTEENGEYFEYQAHIKDGKIIKYYPATPNQTHELFGDDIEKAQKECFLTVENEKFSVNCPNGDVSLNIYSFVSLYDKLNDPIQSFIDAMPETEVPYININSAGFCNGVVFCGASFGVTKGEVTYRAPYFEENYSIINLENNTITGQFNEPITEKYEGIYKAIINSIKDFVNANGFKGAVFGMSGGIDSAVVGALAVKALGKENVLFLIMPGKYSSGETMSDAEIICNKLGARYLTIPINDINNDFLKGLSSILEGTKTDTTEENIQSRIRGVLNMAVSNKTGYCVLTTGNKSEASTGYFTLYGDSCGSLAPIIDLYKTEVYGLADYINYVDSVIPQSIIDRPPTAELAPGQKDCDTLPDYDTLDDILTMLVDLNCSVAEVTEEGYDKETVKKVYNLLHRVEFKRAQYPMGISLSETSFQDKVFWDFPITNRFKL